MPAKCIPGRERTDGLGFPAGCTGAADSSRPRCTAELRGSQCLLCRRVGTFPPPAEWDDGPGWNVVATQTVQAIRVFEGIGPWAVAVFHTNRRIDGQWPVIACADKARAIELALERARQIEPRVRTRRIGAADDGIWRRGEVTVLVAEPG